MGAHSFPLAVWPSRRECTDLRGSVVSYCPPTESRSVPSSPRQAARAQISDNFSELESGLYRRGDQVEAALDANRWHSRGPYVGQEHEHHASAG